jgi:outer membrane cobalamin receptor
MHRLPGSRRRRRRWPRPRTGSSGAASAGTITPQLIEGRPLLRPGNLLAYIPGMVVTQHSGSGKANPYFLCGFNLERDAVFACWVAGMPVNLRTHAHGQGYTDLDFVIPERIPRVDYWKGPYYAEMRSKAAQASSCPTRRSGATASARCSACTTTATASTSTR